MQPQPFSGMAPRGGLSHVVGPKVPPLREITIPQLLRVAVEAKGDAEALVFREQGNRLGYRAFARRVDQCAAGLLSLGIGEGDRVGI